MSHDIVISCLPKTHMREVTCATTLHTPQVHVVQDHAVGPGWWKQKRILHENNFSDFEEVFLYRRVFAQPRAY